MLRAGLFRGKQVMCAAGPSSCPLLGDKHLQQYIAERSINACLVQPPPHIPPAQAVKTMVLMLKDASPSATASLTSSDADAGTAASCGEPAAVVVLLSGDRRVDARAVAAHLGLPRSRLRLAAREEAAAVLGFPVGSIPPFGHRAAVRTLLDVHMLQQAQQLYAGGGSPDLQLLTTAQELLSATSAETGPFTTPAAAAEAGQPAARQAAPSADAEVEPAQQQGVLMQQLPLPWQSGDEEVQLVGVVAQRRRIAKLLLFCSLVPETVPPLPAGGTAAYLRRLWRHPEEPGAACEVQIICGKTIERALGREAAAALFDSVKVGAVVAVTGRVQPNPATQQGSRHVLDVVAHKLEVLHKNRDVLARAPRAAQRHKPVTTAAELRDLQQQIGTRQQQQQQQQQLAEEDSTPVAVGVIFHSREAKQPQPAQPPPAAASQRGAAKLQDSPTQFWQLPLPPECIHWVCDEAGIARMRQAVLPEPGASPAGGTGGAVVALDAEWRPYSRGQPASPVALLQLATRSQVFLVDLLAICQQQQQQGPVQGSLQDQQQEPQQGPQQQQHVRALCEPSQAERALADFLLQLMTRPDVTKLGFQLSSDLGRLQESYPWLPCWRGARLAAHIDLLSLAQLTAPALSKLGGPARMSLSKLVQHVLGAPLDKTQQTSDWQTRPLSQEQRAYAAADTHVLTVVFDELLRQLPATSPSIDELLGRLAATSHPRFLPLPPDQ